MRYFLHILLCLGISASLMAETKPPTAATPASRLLLWLPYYWVDVNGIPQTGPNQGKKDPNSNYDSSIHDDGNPSSLGNSTGPNQKSFSYNNNAAKNLTGRDVPSSGNQGSNGSGGGNTPTKQPPSKFWWPMCVFVDPAVPNGNAIIKGLVDSAGKCGVKLEVYAFTIKHSSYKPNDPEDINKKQKDSCNLETAGIKKGSTQLIGTSEIAADLMCKSFEPAGPHGNDPPADTVPTKNVAGCAQLARGGKLTPKQLADSQNGASEKMSVSTEAVAPSIVDPSGWTAAVASHEGLGHSELGWPNGKDAGNGIGIPGEPKDPAGGGAEGENLDGVYTLADGCPQMRSMAISSIDDSHVWDPSEKDYYVAEKDPANQYDLGKPYFEKDTPQTPRKPQPPDVSPPSPPNPPQVAQNPPDSSRGPAAVPRGDTALATDSSQKHKLPPAEPESSEPSLTSLRDSASSLPDFPSDDKGKTAAYSSAIDASGNANTNTNSTGASGYGYKQDAAKVVGNDTGGSGGGSKTSGPTSSSGSASSSGYSYGKDGSSDSPSDDESSSTAESDSSSNSVATASEPVSTRASSEKNFTSEVGDSGPSFSDDFFNEIGADQEAELKKKNKKYKGLRQPAGTVKEVPVIYEQSPSEESGVADSAPVDATPE